MNDFSATVPSAERRDYGTTTRWQAGHHLLVFIFLPLSFGLPSSAIRKEVDKEREIVEMKRQNRTGKSAHPPTARSLH